MKSFKSVVLIFALTAMIPMQIFAQKQQIRHYDTDYVFKILEKLILPNDSVADAARNTILAMSDEAWMSRDSRMHDALKNAIIPFTEKFHADECAHFLVAQLGKVCMAGDINDVMRLAENDEIADDVIRMVGSIDGSGSYIENYIMTHHDNLKYKAALAYGVGKQKVASMENELVSWLKGADEPTKIDIYKALVVIRSNDKTTSTVKKGAKKLLKSKSTASRIAGLEIMTDLEGEKAMPTLYKALKDKSGDVRVVALDLMKPYVNQEVVKNVMKICKKGDALVDAINWLGDIKDDSQMELIKKQLSAENPKRVEAAVRAIFKIDNVDGINAVKPMFGGDYQEIIKEAMIVYEGNYRDVMNDVMRMGTPKQRLGALQIVENRPEPGLNERVREQTGHNNQEVKDMAYKVLKLVVVPANANALKNMLEICDDKYVEDVQLAIKVAMKKAPGNVKNDFASTLKHVKPDKMPRYYKVFAYFGTELCVDKLIDAYQNGPNSAEAKAALLLVEDEAYQQKISEALK